MPNPQTQCTTSGAGTADASGVVVPISDGWPWPRRVREALDRRLGLDGPAAGIYRYLADRVHARTRRWADTQEAIAAGAKYSVSTVRRHVPRLVAAGILEVVVKGGSRYAGGGANPTRQRMSTVYRLTPERAFSVVPEPLSVNGSGATGPRPLNLSERVPEPLSLTALPIPCPGPKGTGTEIDTEPAALPTSSVPRPVSVAVAVAEDAVPAGAGSESPGTDSIDSESSAPSAGDASSSVASLSPSRSLGACYHAAGGWLDGDGPSDLLELAPDPEVPSLSAVAAVTLRTDLASIEKLADRTREHRSAANAIKALMVSQPVVGVVDAALEKERDAGADDEAVDQVSGELVHSLINAARVGERAVRVWADKVHVDVAIVLAACQLKRKRQDAAAKEAARASRAAERAARMEAERAAAAAETEAERLKLDAIRRMDPEFASAARDARNGNRKSWDWLLKCKWSDGHSHGVLRRSARGVTGVAAWRRDMLDSGAPEDLVDAFIAKKEAAHAD